MRERICISFFLFWILLEDNQDGAWRVSSPERRTIDIGTAIYIGWAGGVFFLARSITNSVSFTTCLITLFGSMLVGVLILTGYSSLSLL